MAFALLFALAVRCGFSMSGQSTFFVLEVNDDGTYELVDRERRERERERERERDLKFFSLI